MPRKPQQSRSRATVDAIVEGALRCIATSGMAGLTTKQIADKGGVSVGSIYEYFDNKEAIVDALYQRFVDDVVKMIQRETPILLEQDVESLIQLLLRNFGDLLQQNNQAYFHLAEQLLHTNTERYIGPVQDILGRFVMTYLMRHPKYMAVPNLDVLSYIMINSGIFVVIRQIAGDSGAITLEQIGHGFGRLIKHYIENERGNEPA
jgi:AcrR family transcriptional regulator